MIQRKTRLACCLVLCLCALSLGACSKEEAPSPPTTASEQAAPGETPPPAAPATAPAPAEDAALSDQTPPAPPIFEDFQGQPQLSLFPRVGDYRPEDEETERLPFWLTFIDHLRRISGVVKADDDANRAWSFRSIDTVDSIAWFAPLAVEPATSYKVSCRIRADLPEQASTGIGILEFDRFLWLGEQYPQSLFTEAHRATREGVRLSGSIDWRSEEFTFTTGPDTRMIHLVLFREGPQDRNAVLFDDIRVEAVN